MFAHIAREFEEDKAIQAARATLDPRKCWVFVGHVVTSSGSGYEFRCPYFQSGSNEMQWQSEIVPFKAIKKCFCFTVKPTRTRNKKVMQFNHYFLDRAEADRFIPEMNKRGYEVLRVDEIAPPTHGVELEELIANV